MIIDHYHTIVACETMPCIQCLPNVTYREDLPCVLVVDGAAPFTVVPLIRTGTQRLGLTVLAGGKEAERPKGGLATQGKPPG